ncbi:hypothetical protein RKD19_004124 [Streptomyces canus]
MARSAAEVAGQSARGDGSVSAMSTSAIARGMRADPTSSPDLMRAVARTAASLARPGRSAGRSSKSSRAASMSTGFLAIVS